MARGLGTDDFRAPEPLQPQYDLASFDSGVPVLDEWLRRRALANHRSGASRTYVLPHQTRVVGYYALAAGAVTQGEAPGRVRRNMPEPIPVLVLGRLAVDRAWQGRGLGRGLLRDALLRAAQAADLVGVRAVLVHALNESARRFFAGAGFHASPIDPVTLMVTLAEVRRALGAAP